MGIANERLIGAGSAQFGFVNVPSVLYKFFKKEEHARNLVEKGEFRIGTLYEFRLTDGWDELRGDSGEGEFTFSLTSETPEMITADSAPWFLKPAIQKIGMPVASHGGILNAVANHPDAFIYCTTLLADSSNIGSYGKFGVVIHDVESFFCNITKTLTDDLRLAAPKPHGFAAPCLYIDRQVNLQSSKTKVAEPPFAFFKPFAKSGELEVRGIWHPTTQPPAPEIAACAELSKCCSLLAQ
jgi:hypothetical protein